MSLTPQIMARFSLLAADLIRHASPNKLAQIALSTCGVGAVGLDDPETFTLIFTSGQESPVEWNDRLQGVDCYVSIPGLTLQDDEDEFELLLAELSPETADECFQSYLNELDTPTSILMDLMESSETEDAVREALLEALAADRFGILAGVEVELGTAIDCIEEEKSAGAEGIA